MKGTALANDLRKLMLPLLWMVMMTVRMLITGQTLA